MNRTIFNAGDEENNIQIVGIEGNTKLDLTSYCEWCGDTESGFGATVSVPITRKEATALRDFLDNWLA